MTAVIGDVIRDRFGNLGTDRDGVELPQVEYGLPVDRTICPRCFGHDEARRHCHVCRKEQVCPTCRNGRVMSYAGRALRYRVCPDCCGDAGQMTETGVPMWLDNPVGRKAAIREYQLTRWHASSVETERR